jgi:dCMP deaminase
MDYTDFEGTILQDQKWDERFMLLAHHLATWSMEKGRRVGAVIVGPDHEIRSTGFNGLPRGVRDDLEERHSRITGAKYIWSCHAEQNAIFNAARVGVALKGCTIYVPWFPCVECTKAIIQCGITELVAYAPDRPNSNWAEDFSISGQMLKEANIEVRLIPRLAELPDASEESEATNDADPSSDSDLAHKQAGSNSASSVYRAGIVPRPGKRKRP